MSEIALVTHEHHDNVRIGMVTQFLEPSGHVLVCRILCNIVNQQCTYSTTVIAEGDFFSLLASSEFFSVSEKVILTRL